MRTLARALGEVAARGMDPANQRREFLKQAAQLLHANVAVGLRATLSPGRPLTLVPVSWYGWLNDREQRMFSTDAATHAYRANPFLETLGQWATGEGPCLARSRRQCVQNRTWYHSEYVQQTYRTLGIDDLLLAAGPAGSTHTHTILAVLRPWGDRASFAARDRELAELLAEAWSGLSASAEVPAMTPLKRCHAPLPPRLAEVRSLLLNGLTEKQVAFRMGLSAHTIHRHTSRLYRAYGVSSRAELLIRCLEQ